MKMNNMIVMMLRFKDDDSIFDNNIHATDTLSYFPLKPYFKGYHALGLGACKSDISLAGV